MRSESAVYPAAKSAECSARISTGQWIFASHDGIDKEQSANCVTIRVPPSTCPGDDWYSSRGRGGGGQGCSPKKRSGDA